MNEKYLVEVSKTIYTQFEVIANSNLEACEKADELYKKKYGTEAEYDFDNAHCEKRFNANCLTQINKTK